MGNSFSTLHTCAARHLSNYTDPSGRRAFATYDRLGDPEHLEPTDALAPALLDAPVPGAVVIKMFASNDTPFTALRRSMQDLLDRTGVADPSFHTLDLDDERGAWMLVREVLHRSMHTPGLAASRLTKMLHRKRPELVPIFDSKVAAFYGTTPRTPWNLWPALHDELNQHHDELTQLASTIRTHDDRPLSALRALDIIVWEHVVTECMTP